MKFRVGDTVLVTGGKDKGKQGKVVRVLHSIVGEKKITAEKVVVENVNLYTKHIKPTNGQAGQKVKRPRALPTANVAIINNEGKADRIGFRIAKDGTKERIFKKTGKVVPTVERKKK